MRGFKKSEKQGEENILTFDVIDDDGKVTGTDIFDLQKPNDVKALFLTIDGTQAGRKRAEKIYNIAKKEKAVRIKKEKEEQEKLKIVNEKAKKSFDTKLKSLIDVHENWTPGQDMPEELQKLQDIIGGLSKREMKKLTYKEYQKLFDKFKNKS